MFTIFTIHYVIQSWIRNKRQVADYQIFSVNKAVCLLAFKGNPLVCFLATKSWLSINTNTSNIFSLYKSSLKTNKQNKISNWINPNNKKNIFLLCIRFSITNKMSYCTSVSYMHQLILRIDPDSAHQQICSIIKKNNAKAHRRLWVIFHITCHHPTVTKF